uniref:Putative secreted mucin n=1 Tax=Amblyomma cajennense TaxID=34607 RepID=A0A023FC09_AMBCJ
MTHAFILSLFFLPQKHASPRSAVPARSSSSGSGSTGTGPTAGTTTARTAAATAAALWRSARVAGLPRIPASCYALLTGRPISLKPQSNPVWCRQPLRKGWLPSYLVPPTTRPPTPREYHVTVGCRMIASAPYPPHAPFASSCKG